MSTKSVSIKVGSLTFTADVPLVELEGFPGKLGVDARVATAFEQAAAQWLLEHGVDGPDALRTLRNAAGLTGGQLAELLNVDRSRVSEWENGKAHPGRALFATVAALARDAIAGKSDTADYLRAMHASDDDRREIKLAVG